MRDARPGAAEGTSLTGVKPLPIPAHTAPGHKSTPRSDTATPVAEACGSIHARPVTPSEAVPHRRASYYPGSSSRRHSVAQRDSQAGSRACRTRATRACSARPEAAPRSPRRPREARSASGAWSVGIRRPALWCPRRAPPSPVAGGPWRGAPPMPRGHSPWRRRSPAVPDCSP